MERIGFQQESRHARWAWRLASFSLVLFVMSGLGFRFGHIEAVAFFWLLGLVAVLAVLALSQAWLAFSRLWHVDETGAAKAFAAALLALVVLAPFAISGARVFTHPRLADISTDTANPPQLERAASLRGRAMNQVAGISEEQAALQRRHYPEITGRRYDRPADFVYQSVRDLVVARGWHVSEWPVAEIDEDEMAPEVEFAEIDTASEAASMDDETTIEAEAATMIFRFPSDVAIRIASRGNVTLVDMRSTSRYGRHDLGDNARRISDFLAELDDQIALSIGVMAE